MEQITSNSKDSFEIATIVIGGFIFVYMYISSFIIIMKKRQDRKTKRYEGKVVTRHIDKDNNLRMQIETDRNHESLFFLTGSTKLSLLEIFILPLKKPYRPFVYLTEKLYKDIEEGSYIVVEGIRGRKGIINVTDILDKR